MITGSMLTNFWLHFSDIAVNNTENANSLIDSVLRIGGTIIRNKYGDRIKIPDINEEFSEKVSRQDFIDYFLYC